MRWIVLGVVGAISLGIVVISARYRATKRAQPVGAQVESFAEMRSLTVEASRSRRAQTATDAGAHRRQAPPLEIDMATIRDLDDHDLTSEEGEKAPYDAQERWIEQEDGALALVYTITHFDTGETSQVVPKSGTDELSADDLDKVFQYARAIYKESWTRRAWVAVQLSEGRYRITDPRGGDAPQSGEFPVRLPDGRDACVDLAPYYSGPMYRVVSREVLSVRASLSQLALDFVFATPTTVPGLGG